MHKRKRSQVVQHDGSMPKLATVPSAEKSNFQLQSRLEAIENLYLTAPEQGKTIAHSVANAKE